MSRRTIWTAGFLTITALAVGMELYAASDGGDAAPTWTDLISMYVPQTVTAAAIGILTAWIGPHFADAYQARGGTMSLKLQPVVWLTTAAVVTGALLEADRQFHVLPGAAGHWLGYAALALGLIVAGAKAHGAVTPLAAPKDNVGRPLVPANLVPPPNDPVRREY